MKTLKHFFWLLFFVAITTPSVAQDSDVIYLNLKEGCGNELQYAYTDKDKRTAKQTHFHVPMNDYETLVFETSATQPLTKAQAQKLKVYQCDGDLSVVFSIATIEEIQRGKQTSLSFANNGKRL